MYRLYIFCFLAFCGLSFSHFDDLVIFPTKLEKKINKVIKKAFDLKDFSAERIFKDELPAAIDLFKLKSESQENIGYAMVSLAASCKAGGCTLATDVEESGHDQFYILTLYDIDYTIKKMKILDFSSSYGYEITAASWLKQFIGKRGGDLKVGDEIDGISGATISVNSLLGQVNKQQSYLN